MRESSRKLRPATPIGSDEADITLFCGRTVAASSAETETWVGVFRRYRSSAGCGAITNHAALPREQAASRGAGRNARWIRARRNPPRDKRQDQRQPNCLGSAERSSPRHAQISVPIGAVRVGAMREAEPPVERVNLLKTDYLLRISPASCKVSMRMIGASIRIWQRPPASATGLQPHRRALRKCSATGPKASAGSQARS